MENLGAVVDEATLLPDLSAAIYRALAELPGGERRGPRQGRGGTQGVGLTFKDAPQGYAWVFDSSSLGLPRDNRRRPPGSWRRGQRRVEVPAG
ncbi:hypothetical protein ACRAWF_14400 [Streptomyces sp. L7]